MNIRTILFDLDGTLIDTNELINQSFLHTFKTYGVEYTMDEILEFNGPPLRDTFEKVDATKVDEMIRVYREHNLHYHDTYVKAFPNVIETVKMLYKKGIKLGIVSTKMRKGVLKGLDLTGLVPYFDTVITLDEVTHAKPHPEPVIKAMRELGGEQASTLMVGDNYHDIEAGQNAGVQTAGVAWSLKGKEFLQQYNPTYMLEDMSDLLKIVGV